MAQDIWRRAALNDEFQGSLMAELNGNDIQHWKSASLGRMTEEVKGERRSQRLKSLRKCGGLYLLTRFTFSLGKLEIDPSFAYKVLF